MTAYWNSSRNELIINGHAREIVCTKFYTICTIMWLYETAVQHIIVYKCTRTRKLCYFCSDLSVIIKQQF